MDAVELNYPVDVVAPKLMGSEGLTGGCGPGVEVKVKTSEDCKSEHVSVVGNIPSLEKCSSFFAHQDLRTVKAPSGKVPYSGCHSSSGQNGEVSQQFPFRGTSSLLSTPEPEVIQRKGGKGSRNGGICPKRPRVDHDSTSMAAIADFKYVSDQAGSCSSKCTALEKSSLIKQKNTTGSKRADKRNSKVPFKTKYDAFSMKAGSTSVGSAAGASNFFAAYGLKTDSQDITKLLDDLSLHELLDGTYKASRLGKDKEKKAESTSENILNTVRKACSVLQLHRPVHFQNVADTDACSDKKTSTCPNSASPHESDINDEKGDGNLNMVDPSPSYKDQGNKHINSSDGPLLKPINVLEQLALPSPKDLESLLVDASKTVISSSKSASDLHSAKQVSRRANLPPFPWSQTFNGHSRTNSDTLKSPMSRNACQGRWVKMGKIANPLRSDTGFTDLELLTYDQSLVPLGESGSGVSWPVILSEGEWRSSSSAMSYKAPRDHLESGGKLEYQRNEEKCPRVLVAAQILYELATLAVKTNLEGIIRWPKKPSQKAMKARKSRSNEKPGNIQGSGNMLKDAVQIMPSKKHRISIIDVERDVNGINCVRKGPANWSTPKSSRSLPSKSFRNSVSEAKHSTVSMVRQSCTMRPPPDRVPDKASSSQPKLKKSEPMDWDREGEKFD